MQTLKNFSKEIDSSSQGPFHFLALRSNQLKHLVKGLTAYYAALKQQYTSQADSIHKLGDTLPLPFHEKSFLQPEDPAGYQAALHGVRNRTIALANIYRDLAASIDSQVIKPLEQARLDIKAFLKQMDNDLGALHMLCDKERELTAQALMEHDKGVTLSDAVQLGHNAATPHQDPFVTSGWATTQLARQTELENKLNRTSIEYQKLQREFEQKLHMTIAGAGQSFLEIQLMGDVRLKGEWAGIEEALGNVNIDGEHFLEHVIEAHAHL